MIPKPSLFWDWEQIAGKRVFLQLQYSISKFFSSVLNAFVVLMREREREFIQRILHSFTIVKNTFNYQIKFHCHMITSTIVLKTIIASKHCVAFDFGSYFFYFVCLSPSLCLSFSLSLSLYFLLWIIYRRSLHVPLFCWEDISIGTAHSIHS